ncbi:MAG: hypothetical protein R3D25_12790 [Geminicoccaceae bacterium]
MPESTFWPPDEARHIGRGGRAEDVARASRVRLVDPPVIHDHHHVGQGNRLGWVGDVDKRDAELVLQA